MKKSFGNKEKKLLKNALKKILNDTGNAHSASPERQQSNITV